METNTRNFREVQGSRQGNSGPELPRVLVISDGTEGGARQGEHERKIGQTQGMWHSRGVQDPSETENTWELEKTCSVEYGV